MASAARAYDYDYDSRRSAAQQPQRSTRVRVVPGTRQQPGVSSATVAAVRLVIVAAVLLSCLALARVALTATTQQTMISEQEISTQVEQVRSANASLEVQKSMLAAPSHVKQAAAALGMAEATATDTINLADDIVATDAQGNLSLSESLARAA